MVNDASNIHHFWGQQQPYCQLKRSSLRSKTQSIFQTITNTQKLSSWGLCYLLISQQNRSASFVGNTIFSSCLQNPNKQSEYTLHVFLYESFLPPTVPGWKNAQEHYMYHIRLYKEKAVWEVCVCKQVNKHMVNLTYKTLHIKNTVKTPRMSNPEN